jgi:hypothetical protein
MILVLFFIINTIIENFQMEYAKLDQQLTDTASSGKKSLMQTSTPANNQILLPMPLLPPKHPMLIEG